MLEIMKTALLHYWLTNMRGGEKVLAALGDIFPDADIFTHAYIPSKLPEFGRFKVKETFIASLPLGRKHPQAYLPLMPTATRCLNLEKYDLIVSSESGPIKGVRKPNGTRHLCYCHTPMRYLWDMYDNYYQSASIIGKIAMKSFTRYLRYEDLKSADSVDEFIANSAFVAERIKRIYGRKSIVVHPPVNVDYFRKESTTTLPMSMEPQSYYLYAGELRDYKRPDLAVEACLRMGRKLVIVGNGKMRERLAKRVGGCKDIVFLGRISDEELRAVFSCARALLFPGIEDFGIIPVESQAAGVPVIARGSGGALETIVEGSTGLFFHKDSVTELCAAIERFESKSWSAEACKSNASRFSAEKFTKKFIAVLG